jgi:hypothetical protein
MIEITVTKHTWLDCSVSWFVKINGVTSGGEILTEESAVEIAENLAKKLGGEYDGEIHNTNELFS